MICAGCKLSNDINFQLSRALFFNFQVSNPLAAVCNVGAYMHSTNLLVATSLRNVLGTKVSFIHEPSLFFYPELIGFLKISYVSAGI